MAKKQQQEVEIISPAAALRSLQAYNESVLMLVSFCETAKSHMDPAGGVFFTPPRDWLRKSAEGCLPRDAQ